MLCAKNSSGRAKHSSNFHRSQSDQEPIQFVAVELRVFHVLFAQPFVVTRHAPQIDATTHAVLGHEQRQLAAARRAEKFDDRRRMRHTLIRMLVGEHRLPFG